MTAEPDVGEMLGLFAVGAPTGVALLEEPCRLLWANPAYFEITGRPPTLVGKDLREIETLKGTPALEVIVRALEDGKASSLQEVPLTERREPRYVDLYVWPLSRDGGRRARAILLLIDETDRVVTRQRARLFYESFMSSTNAIEITDTRGILVDVNPAFERIYGYARDECIGRRPNLVRSRKTPQEVYERMWKDLLDPRVGHWSGELINRDRRGRERPVFITITSVRDERGTPTHYLGVAVDLAAQKAWERGAAHAERLASLGRMAAGVAHEINTPLANVLLVAESIRRRNQDPWLSSRVGAISSQVEVAAKIVRGLLDFSRRSESNIQTLDLVQVSKDAVEFLRGKQSADVEVEERYASDKLLVQGDRGQLSQVLTNLLNNAYEAIDGSGRIEITLREDQGMAELSISDSGSGIPEEALPHLFEPFFTTKEEGKGTGLGLAICHGIVQAHQGTITAHNGKGRGATFVVRIPVLGSPRAGAEGPVHPEPGTPAAEGQDGEDLNVKST